MATPFKLREIEKQYGESLGTLIPRMIEEHGSVFKAAIALEVYPNTIYNWQKQQARKAAEDKPAPARTGK
jgi:hypothetical protein